MLRYFLQDCGMSLAVSLAAARLLKRCRLATVLQVLSLSSVQGFGRRTTIAHLVRGRGRRTVHALLLFEVPGARPSPPHRG